MAIDLFCYTSCEKIELSRIVNVISKENNDIFYSKFILSCILDANSIDQEIAIEYGLNAKTVFLIGINDKKCFDQVNDVTYLIKRAVGMDRIIILWENERLI